MFDEDSFLEDETVVHQSGILYLVSTPIGNLEDISFRALRILKEADLILAEDTRRTQLLLNHYEIRKKMESYYEYNKEKKTPIYIDQLIHGKNIALVSDAGTPGISDPSYNLVNQAVKNKIRAVSIPGPTAVISALVVSGLPTNRYVFEGFLPVKKGRKSRFEQLENETRTIILYESPHRLLKTLSQIQTFLGNRQIAVCRELTKKFEEIIRGSVSEVADIFLKTKIRGEFVLVIQGKTE